MPRRTAAAPAAWGAAADVPENSAQPSNGSVPSGGSPRPGNARSWSMRQPGGIGSIRYDARGGIPTRPHTVGTVTSSNHVLAYPLAYDDARSSSPASAYTPPAAITPGIWGSMLKVPLPAAKTTTMFLATIASMISKNSAMSAGCGSAEASGG